MEANTVGIDASTKQDEDQRLLMQTLQHFEAKRIASAKRVASPDPPQLNTLLLNQQLILNLMQRLDAINEHNSHHDQLAQQLMLDNSVLQQTISTLKTDFLSCQTVTFNLILEN